MDCLIIFLLDLLFTTKTKVLLSSIFLIALSLLNGFLITSRKAVVFNFDTALNLFFGFLFYANVFGLLKVVLVHIFAFFNV